MFGIKYPIVLGPFGGGLSSIKLTSAISNLGGLGSFGAQPLTPKEIIETAQNIRQLTDKPFAINLWVSNRDDAAKDYSEHEFKKLTELFKPLFEIAELPLPNLPKDLGPNFDQQIEAIFEAAPPVFSFIYGIPSAEIISKCKKLKIKTIGAATTIDEAIALENAQVDAVVASGFEAGGHRASFLRPAEDSLTGLFSLVPQISSSIKIPTIAAGGVADGRGIAAALTLGASAVQIGTAFLACEESNASIDHKAALFSEKAKYTNLTKAVSGRLARAIKNDFTEKFRDYQNELAPYPIQRIFVSALQKGLLAKGQKQFQTFWSGQSAPLLKHKEVKSLFEFLIEDTEATLKKYSL